MPAWPLPDRSALANTAFRGVDFAPVPEPFHILLIGGAGLALLRWRRRMSEPRA